MELRVDDLNEPAHQPAVAAVSPPVTPTAAANTHTPSAQQSRPNNTVHRASIGSQPVAPKPRLANNSSFHSMSSIPDHAVALPSASSPGAASAYNVYSPHGNGSTAAASPSNYRGSANMKVVHQEGAVGSSPGKSNRRTLMKPKTNIKPVTGADIRNARIVHSPSPQSGTRRTFASGAGGSLGTSRIGANQGSAAVTTSPTTMGSRHTFSESRPYYADPSASPGATTPGRGGAGSMSLSNANNDSSSGFSTVNKTLNFGKVSTTPTPRSNASQITRVQASPAAPSKVKTLHHHRVQRDKNTAAAVLRMTDLTKPTEPYKVKLAVTRQQKHIFRQAKNPKKIVNLHFTKYPLMRVVAAEMGFEIEETEDDYNAYQFNMCWSDTVLPLTRLVRLGNWQRSNHFPSMFLLCRKGHLGNTLAKMHRKLPTHFTFYPHTWHIRTERALFTRYYAALRQKRVVKYFIIKPNSGCQGRGIMVTKDPLNAVEDLDNYIVQEYIHRPLLCEGRKFDLRIYVLLTSIREPSVFMFNDGLVRMCAESYEAPNDENIKNTCKHLTNYAVNKHSAEYVFNTDVEHGDVGNKRNFRFFNRWLEENGHSSATFWERTSLLIVKTIFAAQPQICQVYNSCFPRYNEGYSCFEVLGFDVLVDSKMKPWLMEINHTPSFMTDTPLDLDIKGKLIREVWDIVDCKPTDMENDRRREREEFTKRNLPPWASNHALFNKGAAADQSESGITPEGSPTTAARKARASYVMSTSVNNNTEEYADMMATIVEKRRKNEDSKLKNFKRIYPSEKPEHQVVYDTVRNLAQAECDANNTPASATTSNSHFTYSPPLSDLQQRQQQEKLRRELRDIANGIYNRRSAPTVNSNQPASNNNNNTASTSVTPRSPHVGSARSGAVRTSTPVRPRTTLSSSNVVAAAAATATVTTPSSRTEKGRRSDELAKTLAPRDDEDAVERSVISDSAALPDGTSMNSPVSGGTPKLTIHTDLNNTNPEVCDAPVMKALELPVVQELDLTAASLGSMEPSPTAPAANNNNNSNENRATSKKRSSRNSPMRPRLIVPTEEELERLRTLQEQLDIQADADPLPASDDDSFDIE